MANYPFSAPEFSFKGNGLISTATKSSTTDHDFKILEDDLCLNGAEILYSDSVFGDYVEFQVIDIDNILGYGANYVVNQGVDKWYLLPISGIKVILTSYAGSTLKDLYLRIKYHSTGAVTDVSIAVNYYLNKKK